MFLNATPTERFSWNFQRLLQTRVSIKCISQNFNIGDLRSGQFCDLSIISQWEKNERRLFWTKTIQNTLKHRLRGRIDTLSRNITTHDPSSCHQGHFRSWKVTSSLSGITFHRDQLEQWKHHRCVQADDADRLICNMTFRVRPWPWPEVKFLTWPFKVKLYIIRRSQTRETRCWQNKYCVFTESKAIAEKLFSQKNGYFFSFCSLEAKPMKLDKIWGHVSERTVKELSNALFPAL